MASRGKARRSADLWIMTRTPWKHFRFNSRSRRTSHYEIPCSSWANKQCYCLIKVGSNFLVNTKTDGSTISDICLKSRTSAS